MNALPLRSVHACQWLFFMYIVVVIVFSVRIVYLITLRGNQFKKEAGFIIGELWKEFVKLKKVYRKATEQQKGMVVFIGYGGS